MRMRPRSERLAVCGALALVLLMLTGCAGLPDSSRPVALGTIELEPTTEGPPPPAAGLEPALLLRDFLRASADPTDRHAAARQYLNPAASTQWDDAASTVIVTRPDTLLESRSADEATYRIRAQQVGALEPDGSYRAIEGPPIEYEVEMSKVDGEWRIDKLPDGVVIDRTAFLKTYRRYSLYFIDPTGTVVVPDLRWIATPKDLLTSHLLGLLREGSRPAIAPVVHNKLAAPVTLRGPITKADGSPNDVGVGLGGVRIDFAGASALGPRDRELLAAQVVLTLSQADILGPYVLLADGEPLDARFANQGGWPLAAAQQFTAEVYKPERTGLHALRDGRLVEVNDGSITPAPGYFGAVNNLKSAALTPDGQFVAAVADAGRPAPEPPRTLMVGSYGGTQFPVAEGTTISRPSWNIDGSAAWAVVDGERVIRVVNDRSTGTVSVRDVDISGLTKGSDGAQLPIEEIRISNTGVRAALIADGRVYVAVVAQKPDGGYALTAPLPVAVEVSTPAISLDWLREDTIIIARDGNVDPVSTVRIDGSDLSALTERNLTPPVRVVSSSGESQYVADSRAVLELGTIPDAGESFWREVPGLGPGAVPVLPG